MLGKPITHLGFAVEDIDRAVEQWVEGVGAGPFCRLGEGPLRLRDTVHAGAPASWIHTTSTGQWGDLLVELFVNHEAQPQSLASAMGVGEYGLHHVGWFADDLDRESARLEGLGAPLIVRAGINEQEFAYHDARDLIGVRIEIYQALPRVAEHYRAVAAAAVDWDGSDPLLSLADFRARYGS